MAQKQMMTLDDASRYTKISIRTLRRYIAEGRLVAYRAGRTIRLRPDDVDAIFTPTNKWNEGVA